MVKLVKKIIIVFMVVFSLISLSYAVDETNSAVNLKLLNQDPDPVKAGDEVIVRIAVENLGSEDLNNFYVNFVDNYPFTLFPDEEREVFVGNVFANSNSDSNNAQIVKFKLKVDDDVDEGSYPIIVRGYEKGKTVFERKFLVEVNSEANAEISTISVDTLVPGKKTKISFGIKNVGKSNLENVKFSWESQDDIILPVGSGNFKYIDEIGVGEEYMVDFWVVSDLNTEPKLYKLDLTLEYDDVENLQQITEAGTIETQDRRTVQSKAGIYVGGSTEFDVAFKEFKRNEATFSVTNIGSNLADSVVVKVLNPEDWTFEGSQSDVIGTIKKGAVGRANLMIKPKSNGEQNLDLLIEYTDTTGQRQQFNKTLSLDSSLFNDNDSATDYSNSSKSSSSWMFYAGIGIVLVVLFVWRLKRKSKKDKKGGKN